MVTLAVELTRAIVAARGEDEITLLCSRERPEPLRGLECEAVLSPYRHEVPLKLRWLPVIEPQVGCDAILYPYWPSPPRRRAGAPPAAVYVHDLAFRLRPAEVPWQQRLYMGTVLPPALRGSAAILVPSDTTRRDLLDCYPVPGLEAKVSVVPEGLSALPPPGPLPDGLQPGFILSVGTIEPRKNHRRLLASYRSLRGRMDPPPLVVAGRPGWAYGDTVERLRTEPGVRYLGHVDEPTLSALYEAASVFAYPSIYEGFGLPVLEAMSHGIPSMIGAAGALPEVAADAALPVDPEDVNAMSSALERLLVDQSLRQRLRDAGPVRARNFTWSKAAALTLDVLRRIGLSGSA